MTDRARTPEEEAEEFLRTGQLTRAHWVTPEQARERWPDAPPGRPPDEIRVIGVDEATREVTIVERWNRPAESAYQADLMRLPEADRRRLIEGDWSAEDPREHQSGRAIQRNMTRRPSTSWMGDHPRVERRPSMAWDEGTIKLIEARGRIAELEAEVEALRKAAGWSDNDAPALGGERAEGQA